MHEKTSIKGDKTIDFAGAAVQMLFRTADMCDAEWARKYRD